jgi:tetratricopeptide (TPR) repeat protein
MRSPYSWFLVAILAVLISAAAPRVGTAPEMLGEAERLVKLAQEDSREGNFFSAVVSARRALEIRQQLLPANDIKLAEALNVLGKAYYNHGLFGEAETWFAQAVAVAERTDESSLEASLMLADLGAALREQGKYWRAEAAVSRSLDIRRRLLAPNSALIVGSVDHLGQIYLATGRYPAAVRNFTDALRMSRGQVGLTGVNVELVTEHLVAARRAESLLIRAFLAFGAGFLVLIVHFVVAGLPAFAEVPRAVRIMSTGILIGAWVLFLGGAAFLGDLLVWPSLRWVLPLSLSPEIAAAFGKVFALIAIFFAARALIGVLALLRVALGRPAESSASTSGAAAADVPADQPAQ